MKQKHVLIVVLGFLSSFPANLRAADHVVYEGDEGPGKGKHILFIASDHEYRGEETCPAIARILAKRYGFKCTVLFGQTDEGLIKPGSSIIPGIAAIEDADMLFLFLRFVKPDDAWMELRLSSSVPPGAYAIELSGIISRLGVHGAGGCVLMQVHFQGVWQQLQGYGINATVENLVQCNDTIRQV